MNCSKCGHSLLKDSEFCQYCGTKVEPIQPTNVHTKESTLNNISSAYEDSISTKSDCIINELPEIETESNTHVYKNNDAIPIVTTTEVLHQIADDNSEKKMQYEEGGSITEDVTKKRSGCEKQNTSTKTTIPIIVVAVLLALSVSLNIVQYIRSREGLEIVAAQGLEISTLEERVTTLNNTVSTQKNTIASEKRAKALLEEKAGYFDIICEELRSGNIGYAASNFKSSESVIVVDKNDTNRKFTLTANWSNGGNVSVDYSGIAAFVSFDNNSWSTSTRITIEPWREGVTVVTFSNDVDSNKFKILIIVTD